MGDAITRWLNADTGTASGVAPTGPILVVDVQYLASGWTTIVYVPAGEEG